MQSRRRFASVAILIAGLIGLALIVYAARVPDTEKPTWTLAPALVLRKSTATLFPVASPAQTASSTDSTQTPTPTLVPTQISALVVGSAGYQAYAQDGDLIVVTGDGTRSTVAEMTVLPVGPWWSPNGKLLLYVTEEDGVVSYHVWDSAQDKVLHPQDLAPDFPADIVELTDSPWSPGGSRVLFRVTEEAGAAGALGYWVLDLTSGVSWLAVERGAYLGSHWLRDDTVIVTQAREDGLADISVALVDPDVVSSTLVLTQTTGAYDISPDGSYVAAQKAFPGAEERGWLQVVPLPAENDPEPLAGYVDGLACHGKPLWSPDGRWIACPTGDGASDGAPRGSTLIVDVTGFSPLQTVAAFSPLVWSPDGRLLTGSLCEVEGCGLAVVDALTGGLTIFTSEEVPLSRLAWSPGGAYLAYSLTAPEDDAEGLVVWERTTGERWVVLEGGPDRVYTDLQWTSDGCRLYASERQVSVDGAGAILALWAVGPDFGQRWQVAPASEAASAQPAPCPEPILEGRRFVAFYGSPAGPGLGILGRYDISTTLELLDEQAQAYRELDPDVETLLAFHMVTTVADSFPGEDGDYNHRTSHEAIQEWVDAITSFDGWGIVDIQPGRAAVETEVELAESLLEQANVHLALDPEFTMGPGEVPGHRIGQMSALDINRAQARLDLLARRTGHRKVLIVHQFEDSMIDGKWEILHYPLVDLVWDADGVGSSGAKIADYRQYRYEAGFEYGGFKIFYDYDSDVMTPERVMDLDPRPVLVIYQ